MRYKQDHVKCNFRGNFLLLLFSRRILFRHVARTEFLTPRVRISGTKRSVITGYVGIRRNQGSLFSISGSGERLCRFHVSLLYARACDIDLAGCFYAALFSGSPRFVSRSAILPISNSIRDEYLEQRIVTKISKKHERHRSICRANITTPGNIVLPGAAERSTNGSSNTGHLQTPVKSPRAIPLAAPALFRSLKKPRWIVMVGFDASKRCGKRLSAVHTVLWSARI